jgi:hypothetical protein
VRVQRFHAGNAMLVLKITNGVMMVCKNAVQHSRRQKQAAEHQQQDNGNMFVKGLHLSSTNDQKKDRDGSNRKLIEKR